MADMDRSSLIQTARSMSQSTRTVRPGAVKPTVAPAQQMRRSSASTTCRSVTIRCPSARTAGSGSNRSGT